MREIDYCIRDQHRDTKCETQCEECRDIADGMEARLEQYKAEIEYSKLRRGLNIREEN